MALIDELVTVLGVQLAPGATSTIAGFKDKIAGLATNLKVLGAMAIASATAAGAFIISTANQTAELETLAQKAGVSTTALQEWSYAAGQAGANAGAVQGDLVKLQQRFGRFGRDSEQTMLRLADRLERLPEAKAFAQGRAFGLSDDTIKLLRKGREGVEELKKGAHKLGGVIPPEAIKRAVEFKRSLAELQFGLKGLIAQVALAALPALDRLVKEFKNWIAVNKEWIALRLEDLFKGIIAGVERFFALIKQGAAVFEPLIEAVKEFVPEMDGAVLVTHLITGALFALALVLSPLLIKFALVAAGVAIVSAVFEDLFTYLEGGESVIGAFFEAFEARWPNLTKAIKFVGELLKDNFIRGLETIKELVGVFGEGWSDLFGAIGDELDALAGPLVEFFDSLSERFPALTQMFRSIATILKSTLIAAFKALIEILKEMFAVLGKVLGVLGSLFGKIVDMFEWAAGKLGYGTKEMADSVNELAGLIENAPTSAKNMLSAGGYLPSQQMARQGIGGGTQINDNKTVTINVATNDPVQAGNIIHQKINLADINTPGQFAPISQ